jgi:hypothetical protein
MEARAGGGEEHRHKEKEGLRARLASNLRDPAVAITGSRAGFRRVLPATAREGGGGGGWRWRRGEAPPVSPEEGATRGPPEKTDLRCHCRPSSQFIGDTWK